MPRMLTAIVLLACGTQEPSIPGDPTTADVDGDGYAIVDGDCADTDPSVHPGADDPSGDDIDTDCDGTDRSAQPLAGLPTSVGSAPQCDLLFGHALATGDLDGDGDDEILVGSQELAGECARGDGFAAVLDGPRLDVLADWHGLDSAVPGSGGMTLGAVVAVDDLVSPAGADIVLYAHQGIFVLPGNDLGRDLDDAALVIDRAQLTPDVYLGAGDVSGDGLTDLAASAFDYELGRSSVRIFRGPLSGPRSLLFSDSVLDDFPMAGISAVDLDGDGARDLAVGDTRVGDEAGAVYVFDAPIPSDAFGRDVARVVFAENSPRSWLGQQMTEGRDLDGDGAPELVVTAMAWPEGERRGKVYVLGPEAETLEDAAFIVRGFDVIGAADPVVHLGAGMTSADLDDDGQSDLALGAAAFGWNDTDFGRVFLFAGPVAGEVSAADADVIWMGESQGDWAGSDLMAGDIDGNGTDDLVIGAPGADVDPDAPNSGRVYLLPGPIAL